MTSVSQLLPNFIQGINEQPDELKKPGQVRDAVNVYPDVITGLSKRTGYECIVPTLELPSESGVTVPADITGRGSWFVLRRRDITGAYKKYLFNISKRGEIKGWDVDSGKAQTVNYYTKRLDLSKPLNTLRNEDIEDFNSDAENRKYFASGENFSIKAAVKEDSAFILNTEQVVQANTTSGLTERPYEAFIEITTLDVTRVYSINFDRVGSEQVSKTIATKIEYHNVDNFDFFGSIDDDNNEGIDDGGCSMVNTYSLSTDYALNDYYDEDYVDEDDDDDDDDSSESFKGRVEEVQRINFESFGSILDSETCGMDDGSCDMAKKYTFDDITQAINSEYDDPDYGDDGTRSDPITLKLRISANKSQGNCNYDIANSKVIRIGNGWKVGDIFEVKIPGRKKECSGSEEPGEDPNGDYRRMKVQFRITRLPDDDVDDDVDNGIRESPITVRVTVAARPEKGGGDQIKCNYYVSDTKLLSGGSGWKVGDKFEVKLPRVIDGKQMKIFYIVTDTMITSGPIDYPNINVAPDPDNSSVLPLLEDLANEITRVVADDPEDPPKFPLNLKTQIIGNGIYLSADAPFKIDTAEKDLINVLSNFALYVEPDRYNEEEFLNKRDIRPIRDRYPNPYAVVNNSSNLPLECKPGFVVKVENSFTNDDDYFVRFVREYKDFEFEDSDEVPDDQMRLESAVGYWMEIAKPGEPTRIHSRTLPYIIKFREEDIDSNPTNDWLVSRVDWAERTVGTYDAYTPSMVNQTINNLCFYRNRLIFLSGSSIVSSTAGDYTNLFASTALTTSPADPIDIQADSAFSPTLHAAIEINNALAIFGEYNQFLLTTDSDIFAPNTAKVSRIGSFQFKTDSEPFMIGTNVGFLGGVDRTAVYEMTNIFREGQVDIIERSKPVSSLIGKKYIINDASREEGMIILGQYNSSRLWVHKYFKENSQTDIQQAWVRWELNKGIAYQFFDQGKHYIVARNSDNRCSLLVNDFKSDKYTDDLGDDSAEFVYPMKLVLPTFYVTKTEQQSYRSDTTASLILHRIHLNTGLTNYYNINIKRFGKDDYNVMYEQSIQDNFEASSDDLIIQPVTFNREETVPLYERNTNVVITLESEYPSPFTLYSMRWEGDYNTNYYRRV